MNPIVFLKSNPRLNLVLIVLWALAIFMGSSIPGRNIPSGVGQVSTLFHAMEYMILGFLLLPYIGLNVLFAAALGSAYGFSDEIHQLFVPGRVFSLSDITVDCIGSTAGAYAAKILGMI